MARIAIPLSISLAALALGACATPADYAATHQPARVATVSPAPNTVVATTGQPVLIASGPVRAGTPIVPAANAFHAGNGTIESIALVHITPYGSASTGASLPQSVAYRLTLRMDDGSLQAVDQDNRGFMVGDRVQITGDGHVIRQ